MKKEIIEETKQLIIQMLLVNGEMSFDNMLNFFKNTNKMKHVGQTVFFLEEDGLASIRIDNGYVFIKLVDN